MEPYQSDNNSLGWGWNQQQWAGANSNSQHTPVRQTSLFGSQQFHHAHDSHPHGHIYGDDMEVDNDEFEFDQSESAFEESPRRSSVHKKRKYHDLSVPAAPEFSFESVVDPVTAKKSKQGESFQPALMSYVPEAPKLPMPELASISLTVKTLSGRVLRIKAERSDLILAVKEQVEYQAGVPAREIRLIYRGRNMADFQTLDHYNVHSGDTLIMATAMVGGYP